MLLIQLIKSIKILIEIIRFFINMIRIFCFINFQPEIRLSGLILLNAIDPFFL